MSKRELSLELRIELLKVLQVRFEKNMNRHRGLGWKKVEARLKDPVNSGKLWSLNEMERAMYF